MCVYGLAMCSRWVGMGFKDTCAGKIQSLMDELGGEVVLPLWVGDPAFHASHRSNLLRKDSVFYGKFGWLEPHDLPYVWPKGDPQ